VKVAREGRERIACESDTLSSHDRVKVRVKVRVKLRNRRLRVPLYLYALAALTACSLDERVLSLTPSSAGSSADGNAGPSSAGTGNGEAGGSAPVGGTSPAGAAGEAGSSDGRAPMTFDDGCTDLNGNGRSDCEETLLDNPAFATDVSKWTVGSGATVDWDALDLQGASDSGSARITAASVLDAQGAGLVAIEQCIAVEAEQVLELFANARLDENALYGKASIGVWFFASADCPGDEYSEVYQTPQTYDAGKTLTLSGARAVPEQMHSARIRLEVTKAFRAPSFSVRFDNVLIVAR